MGLEGSFEKIASKTLEKVYIEFSPKDERQYEDLRWIFKLETPVFKQLSKKKLHLEIDNTERIKIPKMKEAMQKKYRNLGFNY